MPIHHHTLTWQQNTPRSCEYDDIYFNPEQGLEESRYVFLHSNHLPDRFSSADRTQLTIAETGFGTGLNFLLTAYEWLNTTNPEQQLFFISVEKHPLKQEDLCKALQNWPQFSGLAEALAAQYPPASPGYHKLSFENGRITLLLMFGDAAKCYSELEANVDAWYLDGFAPSKNPDMWTEQMFSEMARLSHADTTFSTFTAAGIVKRGLQTAGFTVSKQTGFGRKREMLVGQFLGTASQETTAAPWFVTPIQSKPTEVTIIGGGLAGCSTAYSLAQRGLRVRLIEKEKTLATGGSGNRQGALYAKLPVKPTKQGELHLTGFLHTVRMLKQLDPEQSLWSQCGVIQLALNEKEQKRQADLIASAHYPESVVQYHDATSLTSIANSRVLHDGLYFPSAGWVSPAELCQTLTQHPNIHIEQREITSLDHDGQHWLLQDSQGQVSNSSVVILCNAVLAKQFQQTEYLPLKAIRGQVSITRSDDLPKLTTVVCGDGYISPANDQHYCFGATFDLTGKEANVTDSDHAINMNNLSTALPELAAAISNSPEALEGRTAFRCATADYLPIIGPAPQYDAFIKTFARLRQDKKWRFEEHERAEHHPGLYINTGHGSKGLITCPIASEILAAQLCNEPLPMPKTVLDAVNPARFIIKNLIKQAI